MSIWDLQSTSWKEDHDSLSQGQHGCEVKGGESGCNGTTLLGETQTTIQGVPSKSEFGSIIGIQVEAWMLNQCFLETAGTMVDILRDVKIRQELGPQLSWQKHMVGGGGENTLEGKRFEVHVDN